ncbi:hypothetical protein [Coprobacter fastidiosus]
MKKLISRFSKYDEWGYRNPQFDKLKKVAGTIIMTIIGITFITLIILEESLKISIKKDVIPVLHPFLSIFSNKITYSQVYPN